MMMITRRHRLLLIVTTYLALFTYAERGVSISNWRGLELRGGAGGKRKRGGKVATLSSSSSSKKTATGKKKVGSAKVDENSKKPVSKAIEKYKSILPLTRVYITLVGLVTLFSLLVGEEAAQGVLALDKNRVMYGLELWRPFTAAAFLGKPSISWLMSGYYLFEYGSNLERAYGTAQFLVFLFGQVLLLSYFSSIFAMPFFASSMITAMLHVLSRAMPNQKVKWLIFTVPYWSLPYGLMASDVLQSQSAASAMPHIIGILTGHMYHFHKFIWPKVGGEDWLVAPTFLSKSFDKDSAHTAAKETLNTALKNRKKGKGRKLGQ